MELEELRSKVTDALGSTQLTGISSITIDATLTRELSRITDDSEVTDDYVSGLVDYLKSIDGNIHKNVSDEVKKYKDTIQTPKQKPEPTPTTDPAMKALMEQVEKMSKRLEESENARKASEAAAAKNAVVESVRKSLRDKLSGAGIKENKYILGQTIKELNIPEKDADVKALVKAAEKAYYQNMKDAGFEDVTPRTPQPGGSGNQPTAQDLYWAQKKAKEGWGKK